MEKVTFPEIYKYSQNNRIIRKKKRSQLEQQTQVIFTPV